MINLSKRDFKFLSKRDKVVPDDFPFAGRVGGLGGSRVSEIKNSIKDTKAAFDSNHNIITDIINARLDTSAKQILGDFTF